MSNSNPPYTIVGYADASEGPFRCDRCEYYPRANRCRKKEVVAERGDLHEPGGPVTNVKAAACCKLWNRASKAQLLAPKNG